jgi:two-component system phosphate regulon sensor histidine kinase PhoR
LQAKGLREGWKRKARSEGWVEGSARTWSEQPDRCRTLFRINHPAPLRGTPFEGGLKGSGRATVKKLFLFSHSMSSKLLSPNPFTTFYIVFTYIFVFSLWWAYLLYEKNETAFKEKIELNEIRLRQLDASAKYAATDDYVKLHSKYARQKFMIVTEGGVFIFLLLVGLFRVRKVFLNEMGLATQQRNFLLSITHELKSPLSTIKLSLQTMGKHKLEPERSQKLISNSLADLDRLESLVDNILFAAKIERDQPGFADEEMNVSEAIMTAAERFSHNKKSIAIETDVQPDVYLNMDAIGFTSVINNLVENAIKYSDAGTTIRVSLKEREDGVGVLLAVEDRGIGIADEEKSRIFEKFYRVGNEDTRNTKGTGLGLYIVKRFVEIYKGHIEVQDNPEGGSVFKLLFPNAKEAV